jgi:adenylate kinase
MPGTLMTRRHVAVTGTPGTGKSTVCEQAIRALQSPLFQYINVGDFCKERGIVGQKDEQRDSWILDEDEIVDAIEELLQEKPDIHLLLDYHGCDFWPCDWIAGVFVMRTDNTKLYERLEDRQYADSKIQENVQCEIFGQLLEEAIEAYDLDIVFELQNDTEDQLKENVATVTQFMRKLLL